MKEAIDWGNEGDRPVIVALDYPAIPVRYGGLTHYSANYNRSVTTGIRRLRALVISWANKCPDTPIYLVGYSQGAQVVGDVYQDLATTQYANAISGAVLIGDPRFKGSQGEPVNQGNYSPRLNGIWDALHAPRKLSPNDKRIVSFCVRGDTVCNWSPAALAKCIHYPKTCPHVHYRNVQFTRHGFDGTYVRAASRWLAARYLDIPIWPDWKWTPGDPAYWNNARTVQQ